MGTRAVVLPLCTSIVTKPTFASKPITQTLTLTPNPNLNPSPKSTRCPPQGTGLPPSSEAQLLSLSLLLSPPFSC